jgi:hypothetical protein
MSAWSKDELRRTAEADDLNICRTDDAYRAKYRGSPYLSSMIGARARSATIKVIPRSQEERT